MSTDRDTARLEEVLAEMEKVRGALAECGLSVRRFRALRLLGAEPLRVGRLAELVGVRAPSAVTLVDRLAADGLVARVADPADARASLVEITKAGRRMLGEATSAAAAALVA
jgi:DNA-binding MarR family transcriptional regulator